MKHIKELTAEQLEDARRLKALYESKKKELNVTQYTIADDLEISQGAVGHYLNGRNALNLPIASGFAKILKASISEFSPSLAKEASEYANTNYNVSYIEPYKRGNSYPVLSKVQAGAWTEALEAYTLDDISLWLESDAKIQEDAFWLKVDGESMTSPVGLSIPDGTFVLFDTGREPVNGNLVVAKCVDDNEATFKKLIIDGNKKYLKGLNPQWPLVSIDRTCNIIGVAVETKMRLV